MTLGQKIVQLRNQKGWSQDVFGEKIGVHGRRVSLYENDKSNPSLETLIRIAEVFDVSFDYLLTDSLENHSNILINDKSIIPFIIEFDHFTNDDKKTIKAMIEAIAMKKNK